MSCRISVPQARHRVCLWPCLLLEFRIKWAQSVVRLSPQLTGVSMETVEGPSIKTGPAGWGEQLLKWVCLGSSILILQIKPREDKWSRNLLIVGFMLFGFRERLSRHMKRRYVYLLGWVSQAESLFLLSSELFLYKLRPWESVWEPPDLSSDLCHKLKAH